MLLPAAAIAVAITIGYARHRRKAKKMRRGQTLRGSELLSAAQFNRLTHGDGVGFSTRDTVSVTSLLLGRSGRQVLRVPRQDESSHFLLMGDTGTGKSSLIRQLLEQIADRGEVAIVYDPALEFTPQFYEPNRGDQILNPLDTRMPYWSPGDEVQHKAEALAFAKSLFPDDRRDNRFFIEAPRRVFARLLSFKPTAADIAQWLETPAEIDRRLAGTEPRGRSSGLRRRTGRRPRRRRCQSGLHPLVPRRQRRTDCVARSHSADRVVHLAVDRSCREGDLRCGVGRAILCRSR
jgi:hypothetical protein